MNMRRSVIAGALALVAAVSIGGCGTAPISGTAGPAAESPQLRVGDRWVYRAVDGYRQKSVWTETHEITAIDAGGITVRVAISGAGMDFTRTEIWTAPGVVRSGAIHDVETDRFDPAFIRYQYPLTDGASWSQSMRNLDRPPNPFGDIRFRATVGGYESVSTPA